MRLLQFMSDLSNTLGAETLARYINLDDAIKKFAVANGIDTGGLNHQNKSNKKLNKHNSNSLHNKRWQTQE